MKKIKLVLCLMACVLGLTACGGSDKKVLDAKKSTQLQQMTADFLTGFFTELDKAQAEELAGYGAEYLEYVVSNYFSMSVDGNGIVNGLNSWASASEEMGEFVSITGMSADYDEQGKNIIVKLDITGTNRTAQVEAIYKDDLYKTLNSVTTNINWTFGEKMEKAGLNTLLGMGTVFIVLILICLIISLFGLIPKMQEKFSKNAQNVSDTKTVDNTIAQIVAKEEQTDDLELVAVITAAIAACGTSGGEGDFVVRSIVRRKSQWNK